MCVFIYLFFGLIWREQLIWIFIFSPPFRYVFFLDPCNLDIINRKIKSMALCVSKCPSTELKTYGELKQFALNNGEKIFTFPFIYDKS